ncbi:hypothetical protein H0H81_011833 [Sphagnurus paluster]|uniref:C2H2-type domain-containing protein n=1 Tax=Sphagnurus paluster TaxID=117069 RepID=A0A9P7GH63_9AGAR|nr:hypothetical protein H0H81_011833 [Sphagnurus paluster]
MPAARRHINTEPCTVCGVVIRCKADIPRHRMTHLEDKSALMFKKALHGYVPNGARKAKVAASNNKSRRNTPYTRTVPVASLPSDFEIPADILEALGSASPKVVCDELGVFTDIQQLDLNTTAYGFDPLDTFFAPATFTDLSVESTFTEMSFSSPTSYDSAPSPTPSLSFTDFSSSLSPAPSLPFSELSCSDISSAPSSQYGFSFYDTVSPAFIDTLSMPHTSFLDF